VSGSGILNIYLWHVCYLFYKLSREKPREKWILTYYALVILLYLFVLELSAKTSSKSQKQQKWAKTISPWRAKWWATPQSSRFLRHRDGHGELSRLAKQWRAVPESWKQDKSNSSWREIFLPGEIMRFHLILMTWQKPTGKESSSRHGETKSARRNYIFSAYV